MKSFVALLYWIWLLGLPAAYADSIYEELFPRYVMTCSSSQENQGNTWGHSIIYLKGVCRERVPPAEALPGAYPPAPWKLRLCSEQDQSEDIPLPLEKAQLGVVLSANRAISNSHWVAIPGKNLALSGGLADKHPLTAEFQENLVNQVERLDIYSGLRLHASFQADFEKRFLGAPIERYLANYGFLTDYGISLGRSSICWKIPVSKEQLEAVVNRANQMNERPYSWSGFSANCNHLVVDLLSSAKILRPLPNGIGNLFKLSQLPPAATIVRLAKKVTRGVPTIEEAFENHRLNESLFAFGQLPFSLGTTVEYFPFHAFGNTSYVHLTEIWGWPIRSSEISHITQQAQWNDLATSLQVAQQQLQEARSKFEGQSLLNRLKRVSKKNREQFTAIHAIYERWLSRTENDWFQISTKLEAMTK